MSFSYNPNEAAPLDRVRGRIGDVNKNETADRRLEDETITAALNREGSEPAAALWCVRELLALFAREADVGGKAAGLEATRRFERLRHIEETLLREIASSAEPSLLGLSQAYAKEAQADTDRVQPPFTVGMFDA